MKKKLVVAGAVLLLSLLGLGLWRYSLTWLFDWSVQNKDPIVFIVGIFEEIQGKTMFQRKMQLVEKKSQWPYATRYNIFWNGMTLESGDQVLDQSTWVDILFWNPYGITDLKVYGLDTNRLYYSTQNIKNKQESPGVSSDGVKAGLSGGPRGFSPGKKYLIIDIDPPKKDKTLRIVVTDKFGNVTEAIVEVASINK